MVVLSGFSSLFLDFLLNLLGRRFICDVWRRLNNKGNFLATWWCFFISYICFDKVRSQISFWSHDVAQKIFKTERKKHQNIYFATQNRIINIRIRIKAFKMPIFCFVKWAVQYKQSTFEFLEVTIKLQTFKIDLDGVFF